MVATAAAPYALLLAAGCGFGMYLADRVAHDGIRALASGVLLPATGVLALLGAGVVAGAVSVVRQVAATRRLSAHVEDHRVATPTGAPAGVHVVDHDEPFAFTYGLGEPRIAVSRALLERLSPSELDAVLAHERYHVAARDPLKLLVARAAARTCFFLPAIGHLVTRYVAGRELAADRRSLRDSGRPALAGALVKVASGPDWDELTTAAAMAGPHLLEVRVDQLERGAEPALPRLPAGSAVASALVLAVMGGTVTAVALQGGLSMTGSSGGSSLGAGDLASIAVGGLACMAGWAWLAVAAFRRLTRTT